MEHHLALCFSLMREVLSQLGPIEATEYRSHSFNLKTESDSSSINGAIYFCTNTGLSLAIKSFRLPDLVEWGHGYPTIGNHPLVSTSIHYPPSTTHYPLPTIHYPLASINHPPSTMQHPTSPSLYPLHPQSMSLFVQITYPSSSSSFSSSFSSSPSSGSFSTTSPLVHPPYRMAIHFTLNRPVYTQCTLNVDMDRT